MVEMLTTKIFLKIQVTRVEPESSGNLGQALPGALSSMK